MWSIVHDDQKDLRHLETRGQLPPEFASIRDRLSAEQSPESEAYGNVFEIPYETAAVVTGYEHDAVREDLSFEVLERVSFFKRMFER